MQQPEPDPILQAFAKNRCQYPAENLLQYGGQWIAWSPDATVVIANAPERSLLRKRIREAGEDPKQCVVERIRQAGK